ncbi:MAG: GIY-YIG nuclease family protein [Legionella sp.]|nr:MAG: GIY-YIG nuclease family protein [Legionella sp.]
MENVNYWVYILLCSNNTYYTGYTNNLVKRYHSHLDGSGKCKYTRSFKPLGIVQCWKVVGEKLLALELERYIKKLNRKEKVQLIQTPSLLSEFAIPDGANFKEFFAPGM